MIKYTAPKLFRALCGMAVMLALVAGITSVPVLGATNGIYIAAAAPHYKHPVTGKIEDAGGEGSAVLGQSMTESATYKKALVEVDSAGNTYVTVRLQLMDNIQNPQFQVDGSSVSASLMQEDYTNNTADYRMRVSSENSVIRCNMYVVPMGREVIFYITVSDLQAGSEDFITSITVEQPKQPDPVQAQSLPEEPASVGSQVQVQPQMQAQAQETKPAASQAPASTDTPATEEPVPTDPAQTEEPFTGSEEPSDTKTDEPGFAETETSKKDEDTAVGLQEFDKDGNKVENSKKADAQKTGDSNAVGWRILGGVIVVAVAGCCMWYFGIYKKKKSGRDER